MKVYVVTVDSYDWGTEVCHVFESEESAKKYIEFKKKRYPNSYDVYDYAEFELKP